MSPIIKFVTVLIMILGTGAGVVIVAQADPLRRRAKGSTRRLLRTIVLLGLYLIGSRVFWQAVILLPETVRGEGTPAYPWVIGSFWALELGLVVVAWRVWVDMRRVNG